MTADEARQVMAICNTADGGCDTCARDLCDRLVVVFPEHETTFRDEFEKIDQ